MTQNNDMPQIENCLICHQPHLDWKKNCIVHQNIAPYDSYTCPLFVAQCKKCKEYHTWTNNIVLFLDPNCTAELNNNTPNIIKELVYLPNTLKFSSNDKLLDAHNAATYTALDKLCSDTMKRGGQSLLSSAEYLLGLKYPKDDSDKQSTRNINIIGARIKLINCIMQQVFK